MDCNSFKSIHNEDSSQYDIPADAVSEQAGGDEILSEAAIADLPASNTQRWVANRKAAVVKAVQTNRLTADQAMLRYRLSAEELASWIQAYDQNGLAALKVTKLQNYRTKLTL